MRHDRRTVRNDRVLVTRNVARVYWGCAAMKAVGSNTRGKATEFAKSWALGQPVRECFSCGVTGIFYKVLESILLFLTVPDSQITPKVFTMIRHTGPKMKSHDDRLLRLIAVFKLVKAGLLIALGVGAFNLLHKDIADMAERGVEALRLDPANRFVDVAMGKLSSLSPEQIKKLGLGSFVYAALFLTEGVGLWLLKRWAEWFTVIVTSSLLPIEIYEIHQHPTPVRWGVLAVNLAIVAYLIYRIRSR